MNFFDRYAALCKDKHVDPCSEAMADKIHVTRSAISSWKKKQMVPKSETLMEIAEYFDVTVDYLLGREPLHPGWKEAIPKEASLFVPLEAQEKEELSKLSSLKPVLERYQRLDFIDQARVLSYLDGILSSDKYY